MQLIADNKELSKTLSRLIKTYPNMSFAVAWASVNTIFDKLHAKPSLIQKGIIGTHFYQTHPDVLDAFIDSSNVRFILTPTGVFHPKVYLFWNSNSWEALVGSANLTLAALSVNTETVVHITNADHGANQLKAQLLSAIETYWPDAEPSNKESASRYRAIWKTKRPILKRLSGQYGKTKAKKTPVDSPIMSLTWDQYVSEINQGASEAAHDVGERLDLLDKVRRAFSTDPNFASMELGVRKTIAGLPNQYDNRWGWFGSMKGAGKFHKRINQNDVHISRALDQIPLQGLISKSHYNRYLGEFVKAFPDGRDGIATASRLLALKRPDQFVCFDSRNRVEMCKSFGIVPTGMDYERYWEEIIERILDSPWWLSDRPGTKRDAAVWDGRAAMLDSLFYRS